MEQDRIDKLLKLEDLDINVYGNTMHCNAIFLADSIGGLPQLNEIEESHLRYRIAGRVVQINDMGGSKFIFLKRDNRISQIYVKKETENAFKIAQLLQLGDIIGARGPIFKTKKDKVALKVESIVFLTKALRGTGKILQEGNEVHDKELLYRQRYVDMIMNPDVIETLKKRAGIIRGVRQYLHNDGFIEVETRMLTHVNSGANAKPFVTHHNTLDQDLYLRIAPELDLKRLIVGGMDKIYELGKNFRNEGVSKRHNPEFTSVELYQAYGDMDSMISLLINLMYTLSNGVIQPKIMTMRQAITAFAGVSVFTDLANMMDCFEKLVVPKLIDPIIITHYPHHTSPLAMRNRQDRNYADRFEMFMNGMELANGFSEENNPYQQRTNFYTQSMKKIGGDPEAMDMDEDYCRALEYGMPPTGGLGIGIDRLVMVLLDKDTIRDVIPFPQYRTKENS